VFTHLAPVACLPSAVRDALLPRARLLLCRMLVLLVMRVVVLVLLLVLLVLLQVVARGLHCRHMRVELAIPTAIVVVVHGSLDRHGCAPPWWYCGVLRKSPRCFPSHSLARSRLLLAGGASLLKTSGHQPDDGRRRQSQFCGERTRTLPSTELLEAKTRATPSNPANPKFPPQASCADSALSALALC